MNAIFLDRDGVIIRKAPEGEYVGDWSEVEFLPGSLEAIAALTDFGYKVIVVTNQRGIATGKIQLSSLEEIHARIEKAVASSGGSIAGIYCCTHDNSEHCACRKPKPGMLLQAAEEHQLNLAECWMVGDASTDITAGKSAGCRTALIIGPKGFRQSVEEPDIKADSLVSAAKQILGQDGEVLSKNQIGL